MNGVAVVAHPQRVVSGERLPVPPLVRGQRSGPPTQRTGALQRRLNRRADELRTVGDLLQRFAERLVHLERNDVLFLASAFFLSHELARILF